VESEVSHAGGEGSRPGRLVNPDSIGDIRAVLEQQGIGLKKRWGQNFLVNRGARERLLELLDAAPGQRTWEIGPGLGAMTGMLLARGVRLTAFEVDRGLCRCLREALAGEERFRLVEGDFMETWQQEAEVHGPPERILGNLPYRSASLMIAAVIEAGLRPAAMVVTVQKELAERMTAAPRTKAYSSFSALCQACFSIAARGDLKPGSFFPVPEVVSTALLMTPLPGGPDRAAVAVLSALLRTVFASRRKTLRNNILASRSPWGADPELLWPALEAEGIDAGARAEEVPPQTWVRVARRLAGEHPPALGPQNGGPGPTGLSSP
jgi:16S rRNA (adenine1518-N6/adenine1519-N6)-dimethyltransferase